MPSRGSRVLHESIATSRTATAVRNLGSVLRRVFLDRFGTECPTAGPLVRELGLSRTLAWRLQAMTKAGDLSTNLDGLVGNRGYSTLRESLVASGVPDSLRADLDAAWNDLLEAMRHDRVDRDRLRMASRSNVDIRRDVMQANAQLWGVQLAVQVFAMLFAFSRRSRERIDRAASNLTIGLVVRRRIPNIRLHTPIMPEQADRSGGTGSRGSRGALWVKSICSPGICGTLLRPNPEVPGAIDLVAEDGACGPFTAAFAEHTESMASPWREEPDDRGGAAVRVGIPAERRIMIVGMHEDLPDWTDFEHSIRVGLTQSRHLPPSQIRQRLPIEIPVEEVDDTETLLADSSLGGDAATPMRRLLERNAEMLGQPLGAFRFRRVVIEYPPMPSYTVLRWRLGERPRERSQ